MYRVAVVEDEKEYREQIVSYINRYGLEHQVSFDITQYEDGEDIVLEDKLTFDVIFFDIEMARLNGMDAAKEIRKKDDKVAIVFITNMASYAIEGYAVNALDYVLKPIEFDSFAFRMERTLERVIKQETVEILIQTANGVKKMDSANVYYIEIENRMLHFFTTEGEFIQRGTMQSMETLLKDYHFVKCNHWYLVNLKYVSEIVGNTVQVANSRLEISRRNKVTFLREVTEYIGGGI